MTTRGKIIAFDGPDGIGKTLQLEMAAHYLRQEGLTVHTTRASGGTPIGEQLRTVSLSDTPRPPEVDLYISLAMHTALGQDLQSRVTQGEVCLVDRSPLALLAYNVYGSQLQDKQRGLDACIEMLKLWSIDTLIVFTAPQDIINQRRQHRHGTKTKTKDYFERQPNEFHQRVQAGYQAAQAIVDANPKLVGRMITIDATPTAQQIATTIHQYLL